MNNYNYTYIVECNDGTYYCGWTNDIRQRIRRHNAGKGAKYTRNKLPVKLVYLEIFHTKQAAMKREWAIKQLSRKEKIELIAGFMEYHSAGCHLRPDML